MIRYFEDLARELLGELRAMFRERQLFVLFEQALGCDPKSDHATPKDVYPLYDRRIRLSLDAHLVKARVKITEVFNAELEAYNALLSSKDDEVNQAMLEIQNREHMLLGI